MKDFEEAAAQVITAVEVANVMIAENTALAPSILRTNWSEPSPPTLQPSEHLLPLLQSAENQRLGLQPSENIHLHQPSPPAVEQLLSSFCFKDTENSSTNFPPNSPSKKVRRALKSKPSDPLPIRMKPVKFLKTPQNLNIEKAIWNSGGVVLIGLVILVSSFGL